VLANDLNLSILSPILVYAALAAYGMLTLGVLAYVHSRFQFATKTLQSLKTEWDTAESRHAGIVGRAQEQISKLAVPAPVLTPKPAVGLDMRHQVVAMGRKGFGTTDIAKVCNLPEGEVEVLLGMARLQR